MEWIFYAALPTLFYMSQKAEFLPSGRTRPKRTGWIPAIFLLEAAAVILTLLAVRVVVANTGSGHPMDVWAVAVWTTLLVGITIRTVVVWRGLRVAGIA